MKVFSVADALLKADLDGRREVPFDEAQKETEALGAIFLETSAKTGERRIFFFGVGGLGALGHKVAYCGSVGTQGPD